MRAEIVASLLQLAVHNLHDIGQKRECSNLIEVAIGAYTLTEWDMKIECCHMSNKYTKNFAYKDILVTKMVIFVP